MKTAEQMLFAIAIGDAFGAGYEFMRGGRRAIRKELDAHAYRPHQLGTLPAGHYTDDTQMSIGVVEALLAGPITEESLADAFVTAYRRDPIDGYGSRIKAALEQSRTGEEFRSNLDPRSTANGAAMRSVPFGVLPTVEDVLGAATTNARLTHDTPEGIASSVSIALLSHQLYHTKHYDYNTVSPHVAHISPESDAHLRACNALREEDPTLLFGPRRRNKGIPCDGVRTAGAALYLLNNSQGTAVLRRAVLLGGDTDTVAAVSYGLSVLRDGLFPPVELIGGLQNDTYGRRFLAQLGTQLAERFPPGQAL